MTRPRATFIYSPELEKIAYPDSCPFDTRRPGMVRKNVLSMGLLSGPDRREYPPRPATREEMERFHHPEYLEALRRAGEGRVERDAYRMGLNTLDCPVFAGVYEYSALAGGASIVGAELILEGETDVAFNPSGGFHHAMPRSASGFCYINDVVLAAMTLASAGKRVAILDVDVHHCDGVQHAFYARKDVLTVSLHESGHTLFPGTGFVDEIGTGEGEGYTVNIPLPVGTYDQVYWEAFDRAVVPLLTAYDPDVIMMELGMDALAGDPLAHLHLTNNVHADIIGRVLEFGKPVLATGGGGYHVENTVRGWALAWSVLCGSQVHDMGVGVGGVLLETTEWGGGLRDRVLLSDAGRRAQVDRAVHAAIDQVRTLIFPYHNLT